VLLSVSTDGLVCTSNPDEDDEDEAGLNVGNWGCSIAQAGWVNGHSGSPGIWASSDMETFSTWSSEVSRKSTAIYATFLITLTQLDRILDIDIRHPTVHRQDLTWVTDYLIGCHNNAVVPHNRDNDLSVFLGSNE
jgi:WD repeat-containing protein 89